MKNQREMEQTRLNAYHIMWLFVFFDLPTNTKPERKAAARFRKELIQDGFTMMQYSVYIRHCASRQSADVHVKRVKGAIPSKGQVSIMAVTDKQYGEILNFWGKKDKALPEGPKQLELF
jgi:CRISPR-associated protein Cas2